MSKSQSQQIEGEVNLVQDHVGDEVTSFVNSKEFEEDVALGEVLL